jgi:hypothetical protein
MSAEVLVLVPDQSRAGKLVKMAGDHMSVCCSGSQTISVAVCSNKVDGDGELMIEGMMEE